MPQAAHANPYRTPAAVTVVGAGLAGARTATALRERGFDGRITVLGAEGVAPYDRPPLSKELLSRAEPAWLSEEMGLNLDAAADVRLAEPATMLRWNSTEGGWVVATAHGQVRSDAVVLACGAQPVRPWAGAHVLHTAADAEDLRAALVPGARLVVIGAGWIGGEVAGVAAHAGVEVTVLEAVEPLARFVGAVGARVAEWYDAAEGVSLIAGARVTAVRPDEVWLDDGRRFAADVVLAAVGARPATRWLAGTVPLEPSGAIAVDCDGRVAGSPGLWAVGDCATRPHPVFGPVPGGHWSAALHDPEFTAAAILGRPTPAARPAPYVFSRQLGHEVALFGAPRADAAAGAGRQIVRDLPGGGWAALFVEPVGSHGSHVEGPGVVLDAAPAGGPVALRAAFLADAPREVSAVRRLMNAGPVLLDPALAADPSRRIKDAVLPL